MRIGRALVLGIALWLAAAPGALAQAANPLSPGLPQPQGSVPTATTQAAPATTAQSTTAGDSSLSGGSAIGIALGALVVLAAISLYIWRDARRRAPAREHAGPLGPGRSGSKPRAKPRKLSPAERRRRKRGRAR